MVSLDLEPASIVAMRRSRHSRLASRSTSSRSTAGRASKSAIMAASNAWQSSASSRVLITVSAVSPGPNSIAARMLIAFFGVERLLGKGRAIRIFDPNVQLARLIGANSEYLLQRLPHIAELMVAEVTDAVDWAETIVVTTTDPTYARAITAARSDQIVLIFISTAPTAEMLAR